MRDIDEEVMIIRIDVLEWLGVAIVPAPSTCRNPFHVPLHFHACHSMITCIVLLYCMLYDGPGILNPAPA